MAPKVLIAAGGTGGHLFPAQQLTQLLGDCDVVFAGHKLKSSPFFNRNIPYHEVASSSKKREWLTILKGFFQSIRLVFLLNPDVVVGFGSFHSFPVLLAALILRKKIVLFEANCSLGKVNRFFSPFAKKVAFQFPVEVKNATYVPLLPWVVKESINRSVSDARKSYSLEPELFTILVFGGSQGASFINKTFCEAAAMLVEKKERFQVIHLTGKEASEIKYDVPSVVKEFEQDMPAAYAAADLVISRCGAGTTSELIRYKKPAILIPYPFAHDHQRKNGEFLKNAARVLLQKNVNAGLLADEIISMRKNISTYQKALEQISLPKTTDFSEIIRTVGEMK